MPATRLHKPQQINKKGLAASFGKKLAQVLTSLGHLAAEPVCNFLKTWLFWMNFVLSWQNLVRHDLDVTQSPELLAKPSCLLPKSRHFGAVQNGRQGSECAPETAKAHAQLVRSFGIGKTLHNGHIGGDLSQTLAQVGGWQTEQLADHGQRQL